MQLHREHSSRFSGAESVFEFEGRTVRSRGIRINEVTEETLRDVRDDMLLIIDYSLVV